MENQGPAKRRGVEEAAAGSDRISELPEHILHHHILSLLPQKDAVGTCILSKSWRHLGPTRPKLEFDERDFPESKEKFLPVVENTLQRYADQKLPIQEFICWVSAMLADDPESISLLNKWIPVVVMKNKGLETFDIKAHSYSLPSVEELKFLRRLSLWSVRIEDKKFEKIMSSCPLIQHLDLGFCYGLTTVKVNKARNLRHFECNGMNSIEIDDDAPSLETISIKNCRNWFRLRNNCFLPRLKSLYLCHVHLPAELFLNLSSNNCPCLEDVELKYCADFSEIKISNRSIKRLIINTPYRPIEVAIVDAANMLCFKFVSGYIPSVVSFATTSRECKSHVECISDSNADETSTWLLKLYRFLKALSHSQITLNISHFPFTSQDSTHGRICEPVVVDHLCLNPNYSSSLIFLFPICRPRSIGPSKVLSYSQSLYGRPS